MRFDRSQLAARPALSDADFLYTFAADEIVARLEMTTRAFSSVLYSGPALPEVRAALAGPGRDVTVLSPGGREGVDVRADLLMPFHRAFPLAVSLNDLHLADDPVAALGALRGTLRPDGLLLAAVPSTGTLSELINSLVQAEAALSGTATMRVAPFADVRRWGDGMARAGFALPVADEVRLVVRYKDLAGLLRDLDRMGMRKVLAERRVAPRRLFAEAEAHYRAHYGDPDGKLRATFVFAFLSGWAPDPSQRGPAKRGSATMSLEEALKRFG